jgi:hypothetical protein
VNGTPNGLPSRRPGATIRPDGPPIPPRRETPEPGAPDDPAESERAAAERAREVAEQARRDQEAAAARAAAKAAEQQHQQTSRNGVFPPTGHTANGSTANGSTAEAAVDSAVQNGPATTDPARDSGVQNRPATPDPTRDVAKGEDRSAERQPSADQVRSDVQRPPADDSGEHTSRADSRAGATEQVSSPRAADEAETGSFAAAPPTMPFSEVRPAPTAPPEQQLPPRPAPYQQPASQPYRPAAEPVQQPRQPAAPARPSGYLPPVESPAPARGNQDNELFAPQMPVIAEPGKQGDVGSSRSSAAFELGETTPIFEEIASAWFRSNRPIPVAWQSEQDVPAPSESAPQPAPAPQPAAKPSPRPAPRQAPRQAPAPRPAPQSPPRPLPRPTPVSEAASQPAPPPVPPTPQQEFVGAAGESRRAVSSTRSDSSDETTAGGLPKRPAPVSEAASEPARQPVAPTPDQEFASAADEGWRAVSSTLSDSPDETTAAGLPKRRPRARLVPGSAGSAVLASPITSTRNAETIRGRLASYQSGVRQGREYRSRGEQGSAPEDLWGSGTESVGNAGNNHDEEST